MTALNVDVDPTRIDVHAATSSAGCTVSVSGEVDSATAPGLRGCLLEVLARPGTTTVEVDLRGVTFLDSAGLSALATAHRSAQAGGRDLRMRCGTTRAVARPLQITGLWDVFTIID
ncbi:MULTISPECIES: STAS domain-containing protein [unclassified Modestobacter]|uniref:STAS domain-containing protein n=1 Tax=unclassified Modestobacter TaxID=2643866 RepID=UPI0022AA5DFE|nr:MULTISPECIES: STAS domain-containing protein [unclassified Modestobacter]MCZ2813763.1 STAS domain-containing protein [Modestobacter sp. VKM Ac-2979]MCZ2844262.1 STAS domain-containing protein [Modestobacter sp. VKM Ac-2980]MCZ2849061.1 STAS domain-containing protein [Modestobacter sp. VKM Ac-2978]